MMSSLLEIAMMFDIVDYVSLFEFAMMFDITDYVSLLEFAMMYDITIVFPSWNLR